MKLLFKHIHHFHLKWPTMAQIFFLFSWRTGQLPTPSAVQMQACTALDLSLVSALLSSWCSHWCFRWGIRWVVSTGFAPCISAPAPGPPAIICNFSLFIVCTDPLCSCADIRGARRPPSLPSPRSRARPPAGSLHVPTLLLPMGRAPGGGGVPPEADPPHQHPSGGRDCLPGHGHAPARTHRLDHHALLPWPPVFAGPQEAGEVWRPPTILRYDDADRHADPSRQFHLPARAQQEPEAP